MSKKKNTRVIFPVKDKEGKVKSICGLPVFGFKNYDEKNLKPLAYTTFDISSRDTKTIEKSTTLRCDIRLVRSDKAMEKMYDDNSHLIRMSTTVAGYDYYVVVVMAKDFFISKSNFKLAQTWVADSFICSSWNASGTVELPLNLLNALMNERKTNGKLRKAVEDLATNTVIKYSGCSLGATYDCGTVSDIEYASSMRALLSVILRVRPKEMILSEYKISKKLTKMNVRIVKRAKKVSVSDK